MLHLGPRPRTALEDWDKLDTIDEIDDTGKTPGVERMMKYFEEKLELVTVADIGHNVEDFFRTFSRKDGEAMRDYVLTYEKYMRELTESLKAFDPSVK